MMAGSAAAEVGMLRSAADGAARRLSHPSRAEGTDIGPVRVGVDVAGVAEVADSVRVFGDRYLGRIYTPHELECCRSTESESGLSFQSLAARFAAKEAAIKVLRPDGPRPEWRAIEVRRQEDGACELRLTGLAASLADRAGLDRLAVSLTHDAGIGAAVVVALGPGSGEAGRSARFTAECTSRSTHAYP